jgi:hypothetical protein
MDCGSRLPLMERERFAASKAAGRVVPQPNLELPADDAD